jgi:hypothetical protein
MGSFWIMPLLYSVSDFAFAGNNFTNYGIVVTSYSVDKLQNRSL